MKRLFGLGITVLFITVLAVFSSCSSKDYLNVIPEKSSAIISIDLQKMTTEGSGAINFDVLKSLLHVDDVKDCGIDGSAKLYLFETADGNLGLCAKVSSEKQLEKTFQDLSKQGDCQPLTERKDYHFTVLKDSWLVGFSDNALLVMGPVVADAQANLQRQMVKYLSAKEDEGIKETPMFDSLDSIASPMALVTQAQALPEKFVAPFVLGAPKSSDASQIIIAAEMQVMNGILSIKGKTFSFNKEVDAAFKSALANYRPIKGKYLQSMANDALAGIFMNVDGKQFLPMMQANKGLQTLLMGINTAIDMDNIIRSIDGDMAIVLPTFSEGNLQMRMSAQLTNPNWLADVNYWKQSCPAGTSIQDKGKDTYCYSDGKTSFFFGVTADKQFFSGNDMESAKASIAPVSRPIGKDIQQMITGQKMAMVLNLCQTSSDDDVISAVMGIITPIFGDVKSIVYTLK